MKPAGARVRPPRLPRLARALMAGFFLVYLIALSPHLAHHLFDEDHGRPACPHFAQSQQTSELQTDPPALMPPAPNGGPDLLLSGPSLVSADLTLSHPRAPPRSRASA